MQKNWVISISQDGGRYRSILLLVSYLLMSLPSEGQSLSANQISSTYLNSWLRYNYFRLGKNKRPPYWNSTSGFDLDHVGVNVVLFCMREPNFVQIGPCTAELWRHIDFQHGGSQPCICSGIMADHLLSAFRGLNSDLKSLIRQINSSGDIAMYRFWRFGLKLSIHAPLWGVFLGHIFPIWRHSSSRPPIGPSLGGSTSFEPFRVKISATVRPWRVNEKKMHYL